MQREYFNKGGPGKEKKNEGEKLEMSSKKKAFGN